MSICRIDATVLGLWPDRQWDRGPFSQRAVIPFCPRKKQKKTGLITSYTEHIIFSALCEVGSYHVYVTVTVFMECVPHTLDTENQDHTLTSLKGLFQAILWKKQSRDSNSGPLILPNKSQCLGILVKMYLYNIL